MFWFVELKSADSRPCRMLLLDLRNTVPMLQSLPQSMMRKDNSMTCKHGLHSFRLASDRDYKGPPFHRVCFDLPLSAD